MVRPSEGGYQNNAACVGSGTVSYGAMGWRFMEQDFKMRSTYGAVPGSTLEDWPIGSARPGALLREGGVGDRGFGRRLEPDPFKAPRKRGLPMPPLPANRECEILRAAAKRLGWHPVRRSHAAQQRALQRPAGLYALPLVRGPRLRGERQERHPQHRHPDARMATGNCEVRTNCHAGEILTDSRGRARGVAYFDERDRLQEQTADMVIVSGAAIESARLLLLSKSKMHPQGSGQPLRLGGAQPSGPLLSARGGPVRAGDLRRSGPLRRHRASAISPMTTRAWRAAP